MLIPPINPGVHLGPLPGGLHPITAVATSITAFVGQIQSGPVNNPTHIFSFADFAQLFGGWVPETETSYSVQQFFQNGGTEAWVVNVTDGTSAAQLQAGIQSLDAVNLFNLLVLPGVSDPAVAAAAVDYCQKRRAFLILDSPASVKTPEQMTQAMANGVFPQASNAAVYYPWVVIADQQNNGQTRITSPSGTIAGVIANTDASRGVWKAPAGVVLSGVQGLEYELNDAQNGTLNPLGVNCLRTFPVMGNVVWGARTLQGTDQLASVWKYVPVRRLALFIEESLYQGTQWAIFEPNDETLWAALRLNIGAFMQNLFLQGAFQGQTPQAGYFVKCDAETTTQADIDNGLVNIMVGFAPLIPAEFVVLSITQITGQTTP
jgi:phage tail sheath protein FI